MVPDHIVINDDLVDPTGEHVKNYMFNLMKETSFLDYKLRINIIKNSDFPKFVKDAMAFANNGGGFILLGMEENEHLDPLIKGKFIPTGLPVGFHIDQADLQQNTNSYLNDPIEIDYDEFTKTISNDVRKFAIAYIRPSKNTVYAIKNGEYQEGSKKKLAFVTNKIYTRRGTQSIIASPLEIDWIKKRVKDENYRLSIISGEPDKIEEPLFSNLFEVKKLPEKIYIGEPKFFDRDDINAELKKHMKYSFQKFRFYENKIVTLQNLTDPSNSFSNLVYQNEVIAESIENWLENPDKRRILISLMNFEIIGKGMERGMWYNGKTKKLFFHSDGQKRSVSWPSKYRASKRTVANQVYASQLKAKVFLHPSIHATFLDMGEKFFLRINPTFVITTDGQKVISGLKEGTIITRLSYNKYNDAHLNNILFWINQLGNGTDIHILNNFIVSSNPVTVQLQQGIAWDIPSTEIKSMIEQYKPEVEEEVISEDDKEEGENEFLI